MEHLFDTCTFFNELNEPSNIIELSKKIYKKKDKLLVTDIVIEELMPTRTLEEDKKNIDRGIINGLHMCEKSSCGTEIISIGSNEEYKKNYNDIRKRYYSHINPQQLSKRVKSGEITNSVAKILKKKDRGECSCIAVAITKPSEYCIVSEDEGRVCEKPDINIFDIYRNSHNLKVYKFNKWKVVNNL